MTWGDLENHGCVLLEPVKVNGGEQKGMEDDMVCLCVKFMSINCIFFSHTKLNTHTPFTEGDQVPSSGAFYSR